MDLTAFLGVTAIAVTVGTLALLVRDVLLITWQATPAWFRLALLAAMAIGLVMASRNLMAPG